MQPDVSVVSLISIGQHPKSARARRAGQDARAVELGLKLVGDKLLLLHAGSAEAGVLRSYLGMGLKQMTVLEQPVSADAIPVLGSYLREKNPHIVLTGVQAEGGESSGMTPYLLAQRLGWTVVDRIADIIAIENGEAEILQALPRGQRRALKVRLPFVASVDTAAMAPRQSAYGPARRAVINTLQPAVTMDILRDAWSEAPAKKRPKRLQVVTAKTAADRFKAATAKAQGDGGKIIAERPPRELAQAIFDLLVEEGVLR